jgi:uncharacterized protein with PQ loop repeat
MIFLKEIESSLAKNQKPVDSLMWFLSIVGPISTIPQIVQIYGEKSADGVSVLSWSLYLLIALSASAYAIVHKQKVILIGNILWSLTYIAVIVGAIIYG